MPPLRSATAPALGCGTHPMTRLGETKDCPSSLIQLAQSPSAHTSCVIVGLILTTESPSFENMNLRGLVEDCSQAKRNVPNLKKTLLLITTGQSQCFGSCKYQLCLWLPTGNTIQQKEFLPKAFKRKTVRFKTDFKTYTRLPGQQITVRVTLFRCSFNMGTSAEWLMPTVDRPLTATIMSPHLDKDKQKRAVNYFHGLRKHYPKGDLLGMKFIVSLNH